MVAPETAAKPQGRHLKGEFTDFAHTGPERLMGRWMRVFWHPVYRSQDLPVGRAKPVRIMNEDFTLYRGESGSTHAIAFRCAHRGTQLSTGWVEGDNLRCFYHGWVYDGTGQCIEQPAEPLPFCHRVRIRSYPVSEYLGLVFAYLGEGEPPPLPRFPAFEDDANGVLEVHTYTWPCNWENSIENDPVHSLFVHRDAAQAAGRVGYPTIRCEETDEGFDMRQTYPDGLTTVTHNFMPNGGYNTGRLAPGIRGTREAVFWRVPVDDTHFTSLSVHLTQVDGEERARYEEHLRVLAERAAHQVPAPELGEAVLRGEIRIEDITDLQSDQTRRFNVQDYVSQVGQGRMIDRSQEHLGRTDPTVILQRKLWQRELRVLAEGGPLKRWVQARTADP